MPPLRSLLFVPGNRPNMIQKALEQPADALIFDLEDSVPAAEKEAARNRIAELLKDIQPPKGQQVYVRINSLASGLAEADLRAVVGPRLDGINLPKPGSAEDIHKIEQMLEAQEGERGVPLGQIRIAPWIETARAIINVFEIATASPRISAIAFGADDFTRDMGIVRSEEGTELTYPRAMTAIAAMAAGIIPLDSPYVNFRDGAGLIEDTRWSRQIGFKGRCLIHPSKVEPVNRIFSPSPEEIEHARRVVAAFEEAEARGSAATSVEGKMVDVPVVERARRLLELAEAIARKEPGSGQG